MSVSSLYTRMALGLTPVFLAGCTTLQQPNTDTCMQVKSVRALVFNTGGTSYNTDCNDGRTSFALLNRAGDPVGNALGFLLYMDQNKQAKTMLEQRMGGKDKVTVAPETIAGLLTSADATSRYLGLQIYSAQPEEGRVQVNDIITATQKDPKELVTAILAENQSDNGFKAENRAREWARDHATAPKGVAATTCAATPGCQRTVTQGGVEFTFSK